MTQLWSLLVGLTGAVAVSIAAAVMTRRRTTAETGHHDADAADVLSQGAVRLVPYYESRIASLEARLSAAETATAVAQHTATAARESEARCLARLDSMQAQIDVLRALHDNPPTTTTVTTQVTTQEPAHPAEEVPT